MEVDGPTHFLRRSPTKPDGATTLRNRHLAVSYGIPVLSINVVHHWAGLRSQAVLVGFLKALFESVVLLTYVDLYVVDWGGHIIYGMHCYVNKFISWLCIRLMHKFTCAD